VTPRDVAAGIIAGSSVVLASITGGCGSPSSGERLPDVPIEALGGAPLDSLRDVEGPAVVNLWATWCVPCRTEIPDFEAVHRGRGDVEFVGINVGEEAPEAAAFIGEVGATYDQYLDRDGSVVTALDASTMPFTLVIDADGEIVERHAGAMSQSELGAAIDRATDP
jgi:thiol-disulfide isomerase/thioredoxin